MDSYGTWVLIFQWESVAFQYTRLYRKASFDYINLNSYDNDWRADEYGRPRKQSQQIQACLFLCEGRDIHYAFDLSISVKGRSQMKVFFIRRLEFVEFSSFVFYQIVDKKIQFNFDWGRVEYLWIA